MNSSQKKIVIVGAGLGGLFSAAYLSKLGYQVEIYESHNKIGGLATWYYRDDRKYLFSISPHIVPKSLKKFLLQAFGKEIADLLVPYPNIYFEKIKTKCIFDRENFKLYMSTFFTQEDMRRILSTDDRQLDDSIGSYIQEKIDNKKEFYNYIYLPLAHAKGISLESSIRILYQTLDLFLDDGCYGFSANIAELMKQIKLALEDMGVQINLRHRVKEIERTSDGFELSSNNKLIKADAVFWNAPPTTAFDHLEKGKNIGDIHMPQIVSLKQVSFGVNLHQDLEQHTLFLTKEIDPNEGYFHFNKEASTLVYTSIDVQPERELDDSVEYYKKKCELMAIANELVRNHYGASLTITIQEASTSKTVHRYTDHFKGAIFGYKKELDVYLNSIEEKNHGFYFVGARGEEFSGWLGLAKLAKLKVNQCQNLLMVERNEK